MSALNFVIQPDIVVVSTDTLRTEPGGVPVGFTSKIFPLPHLHGVLCGTGSLDLILEWFVFVQTQVIALDMRNLDDIAPSRLPLIADKHETLPDSTIYHFGLDARAGHLGGWVYRSTAGFRSERLLARSLGVKPPTPGMEPPNDPLIQLWLEQNRLRGSVHAFAALMQAQQALDRDRPASNRVGIGGEMHILILTRDRQTLWTCCPLPYFRDDFDLTRIDVR